MSSVENGSQQTTLEFTPTWIVAAVCSVIVVISLTVERLLHYLGKYLKRKNQEPLYQALQKIKEELMLLGFISLLLTVLHRRINHICISEKLATYWLPCKKKPSSEEISTSQHSLAFSSSFVSNTGRHLLAEYDSDYCAEKGTVPLLSTTALLHLHIFIFVLAVVHVLFCALTILFGGLKISQWKKWEDSVSMEQYDLEEVLQTKFTHVREHDFIKDRFMGIGKNVAFMGWLQSFCKQFHGSVTKSDYITLRLGFVMTHCKGNPKFNFHNYMIRALEVDFRKVVGISWYLWIFVVIFLLLNVAGWHSYFYLSFIPFILLLAVGTKLEHVITQLAHEVAEKHVAVEGDLIVRPSDDHFWFRKPKIVLVLIHVILFQNSFELAFFFWVVVQYKFHSCMMEKSVYIIPRLVMGGFVQFLCSYSTLPLYAIVTQMGSSYKNAIFQERIQVGLSEWAKKARKKQALRKVAHGDPKEALSSEIQIEIATEKEPKTEKADHDHPPE